MNSIFVGNLSFAATQDDVRKLFEGFGSVTSVLIMKGKKDKSRGFGFVDMAGEEQAKAARAGLEGKEFMGRPLSLSPARPRVEKETKEFMPKKTWEKPKDSKPWDKRKGRSKPFHKFGGPKLWTKKEEGARPYRKDERESKPWDKSKGGPKPFKKFTGSSSKPFRAGGPPKPWRKNDSRPKSRPKNF